MPVGDATQGVEGISDEAASSDVCIFDISGKPLTKIKAANISSSYRDFLQTLTKGIYIIKEGNRTRKLMITK